MMKTILNLYIFLVVVALLEIALAFLSGWISMKASRSKAAKIVLTICYVLVGGYLAICWSFAMLTVFVYTLPSVFIAALSYPPVKRTAFAKKNYAEK